MSCSTQFLRLRVSEPEVRNQAVVGDCGLVFAAPVVFDRFLELVVFQVGMITDDDLQPRRQFADHVVHELIKAAHGFPVLAAYGLAGVFLRVGGEVGVWAGRS